jgi:MarR family transcriptional regulator, organic hydroperoxide resistance regulator
MTSRRKPPSTDLSLELTEFLCFSIYSASHAFNRVYQPLLKDLGLTYTQFVTMILLWEEDGQTVGKLGEKLLLQSNTLTPLLKRLESLGYIDRTRHAADERQVIIRLTEAGRSLRLSASAIVQSVRKATGLKDHEFKTVKNGVDLLRKSLERSAPR